MAIEIKSSIVSDVVGTLYDKMGVNDYTSPKKVKAQLKDCAFSNDLIVNVSSGGGDVFAASEIYTMLRDSGKKVTVNIQGLAASAASVISMAGDTVRISPTAQIMIHKSSSAHEGNADGMSHNANVLDGIDKSIAAAYAAKTGMKESDLLQMMSNETWLTAKDAVDKGFADEIMFNDEANSQNYQNSTFGTVITDAVATQFLNSIQQTEKQPSQPTNSVREQKLAILLDKKGEN